jgi:hypothetical protein
MSLRVACDQAPPPSRESHSPSVVPASRRLGSPGVCANARVRRLLDGIPRILVQRAAASVER